MKKLSSLLAFGLISLIFIGCKTKVDKTAQEENDLNKFKQSLNDIGPNIKSVEDISTMLYLTGADFHEKLISDPMQWENNIEEERLLAANMGIYIIDGFYQMAFDKKKDAYMSFMAGKSIAAKLDALDIFDEIVLNKLDEGVVPPDDVIKKVANILHQSEEVFGNKDAYRLFASFIIGSYIEKQYILFNSIFNQPAGLSDDEKFALSSRMIIVASEQLKQLPALIKIVEEFKTDEDPGILYDDLKKLEALHSKSKESGSLNTTNPADFYKDADLKKMHQKVNEMRNYLVMGQK